MNAVSLMHDVWRRVLNGELRMPVWPWEVAVQAWVKRQSVRLLGPLTVMNFLLADEAVLLTVVLPTLFWLYGSSSFVVGFAMLITTTKTEDKLKAFFHRGRPRSPDPASGDYGIPSGDCMLVATWAPLHCGWWALLPIAGVMWARMARDAHYPLDTIVGAGLGFGLASAALRVG